MHANKIRKIYISITLSQILNSLSRNRIYICHNSCLYYFNCNKWIICVEDIKFTEILNSHEVDTP